MLNLAYLVESVARRFPNETALIDDDRRFRFRDLQQGASRVAQALRGCGIGPGDHVAMMLPNGPEFTLIYFGILYAGAVVVPLNYLLVPDEIAYHLEDSQARAFFVHTSYAEAAQAAQTLVAGALQLIVVGGGERSDGGLRYESLVAEASDRFDPVPTMPDDTAVILYTSGTTGRSKGAELTHLNLYSNAQWCAERGQSNPPHQWHFFTPGQVGLACLPLFHSFGQTCVQNAMLFHGAAITYLPRWDPERALHLIARDRVTFFAGVPTMYFSLLQVSDAAAGEIASIKFCVSGGAPMPVEVMQEFDARFGVQVLEGYGLSETSPVASFHTPERPRKIGSIGYPIFGCEMKVFDADDHEPPVGEVGEVVIRGLNIMKGYYRRPEATAEALRGGWFHTGDLGRQDDEGYFYIVDRKKDMIIRGGFNVYPRELEEVLYAHPAICECAVIGVPDPEHGEEIKAVVALRDGVALTESELREWCKARMAAYKYPRRIEFRSELPKGPTGKILKRALQ